MMTKENFDYTLIPGNFIYCLNQQCPRSGECLRYLLSAHETEQEDALTIVSPALAMRPCRFYAPDRKVSFALGITEFYDLIPRKAAHAIKQKLIAIFSRTTYYRWKRRERLIYPQEQDIILQILREANVSTPPHYDEYIEQYDWQSPMRNPHL
ncbi:MAG: DUF6078 family protein [Mediterranea sp.]|jgi:hypothetical protein|nr:DUF6078 family protein [Mediterranea sp.]